MTNKISLGEVVHKQPVYILDELAANIEKITVKVDKVCWSFIVGKSLYEVNNLVIVAFNGTTLLHSTPTAKYCKTRRGNMKPSYEVKTRVFKNITNPETGLVSEFKSPGVLLNYSDVMHHLRTIYTLDKVFKIEDIASFLTYRTININNYTKTKLNGYTRICRLAKRIFRRSSK